MRVKLLKSKLHRATVTDASLHYEGSISIPPSLVKLAHMYEYERVLVANVNNGARVETYVIPGHEGQLLLNGASAHLGKPGAQVIISTWATME